MQDTYIVYIDEFGHIGPYVSLDHSKHKTMYSMKPKMKSGLLEIAKETVSIFLLKINI